jgi:hypothetical protein
MTNIQELKAKAYDLIAGIERAQLMLKQVNDQIAQAMKAESEKAVETAKEE